MQHETQHGQQDRQAAQGSGPNALREYITAPKMDRWFRNALGDDERMPSAQQCLALARELKVLVNRANNDQLRREAQRRGEPEPSLSKLTDVPPDFRLHDILEGVAKSATQLNRALDKLEDYSANYVFADPDIGDRISAKDVRRVCVLLGGRWTKHVPADSDAAPRGQPPKAWHAIAREFAGAVERSPSRAWP